MTPHARARTARTRPARLPVPAGRSSGAKARPPRAFSECPCRMAARTSSPRRYLAVRHHRARNAATRACATDAPRPERATKRRDHLAKNPNAGVHAAKRSRRSDRGSRAAGVQVRAHRQSRHPARNPRANLVLLNLELLNLELLNLVLRVAPRAQSRSGLSRATPVGTRHATRPGRPRPHRAHPRAAGSGRRRVGPVVQTLAPPPSTARSDPSGLAREPPEPTQDPVSTNGPPEENLDRVPTRADHESPAAPHPTNPCRRCSTPKHFDPRTRRLANHGFCRFQPPPRAAASVVVHGSSRATRRAAFAIKGGPERLTSEGSIANLKQLLAQSRRARNPSSHQTRDAWVLLISQPIQSVTDCVTPNP